MAMSIFRRFFWMFFILLAGPIAYFIGIPVLFSGRSIQESASMLIVAYDIFFLPQYITYTIISGILTLLSCLLWLTKPRWYSLILLVFSGAILLGVPGFCLLLLHSFGTR